MKSLATALAAVALFCLAAVPAHAQNPAVDLAAEKTALLAAAKAFSASTGDLDKRMSFFADDAIRLGPGQGAIIGKAAIRARAAELKALPGFAVESELKSAELAASGDLGYTFSAGKASVESGGKIVTLPGHVLTIWKKQGGAWKVVAEAISATPGAETTK